MGLKDKMLAKSAEIAERKGFTPLELTEGNVQAIFNRCLATKETSSGDEQLSILFQKALGYDKDSAPMVFSKAKIAQNRKSILYLMGQLKSVHAGSREITSAESIYRYDGRKWSTDTATIMELYHLAEAANGMSPFIMKYNVANTERCIVPTLSPKGPNFPTWWEAHKGEWEQ